MRAAFGGIVDYAGLFPPASCTMARAVASYDSYRGSNERWMLGRFVVAASRLDELGTVVQAGGYGTPADPWRIAAVLGANIPDEVAYLDGFRDRWSGEGLVVDAIEFKVTSAGQVLAIDELLPRDVTRFLEVPPTGPYEQVIAAIATIGAHAKIRTGGTLPDFFPKARDVVDFLAATIDHDVAFKATAGLHHPYRGSYPLTYDHNAERHTMFGFVNLLIAAAELARTRNTDRALEILEDDERGSFQRQGDAIVWRGMRFDAADLAATREHQFLSFGSCSFREPVDELALASAA